jgi:hypothetical protein
MEDCSGAVFDGQGQLRRSPPAFRSPEFIGLCLRTIIDHYIPLSDWHPGDWSSPTIRSRPTSLSSHHQRHHRVLTGVLARPAGGDHRTVSPPTSVHLDGVTRLNVEIEQEGCSSACQDR